MGRNCNYWQFHISAEHEVHYIEIQFMKSRQETVMYIGIGCETKTSPYSLARFIMTSESQTWVSLWKKLRKSYAY
jgi:hypothetical protein